MLNIHELVLKYDLDCSLSENEEKMISYMSEEDFIATRRNIYCSMVMGEPIDKLEEYMKAMVDCEYQRYLSGELKTSDLKAKREELDSNVTTVVINMANKNFKSFNPKKNNKITSEGILYR